MIFVDRFAKKYEALSRAYRYPDNLVGRTLEKLQQTIPTDILVFAAHPDDESLGLGTVLYRHRQQGDKVSVVFTTNGRGGSGWTTSRLKAQQMATLRHREACNALSIIGIPSGRVSCLGFPDMGLYRYASECMLDIDTLISRWQPKKIYVHSSDGGHIDHDITSIVVLEVCRRLNFSNVYEWAEYNTFSTPEDVRFVLPEESAEVTPIIPSGKERLIKQSMLENYLSQYHILKKYRHKYEVIRRASLGSTLSVPTLYDPSIRHRAFHAISDLNLHDAP